MFTNFQFVLIKHDFGWLVNLLFHVLQNLRINHLFFVSHELVIQYNDYLAYLTYVTSMLGNWFPLNTTLNYMAYIYVKEFINLEHQKTWKRLWFQITMDYIITNSNVFVLFKVCYMDLHGTFILLLMQNFYFYVSIFSFLFRNFLFL